MDRKTRVEALDHLVLTVANRDRTGRFHTEVLGMREVAFRSGDGSKRTALACGAQINLHVAGAEVTPHAAQPVPGSADLCFLSATPPDDWRRHLAAQGIAVELGPVPRAGATGPILSIYLRDPDGNLIEIGSPA